MLELFHSSFEKISNKYNLESFQFNKLNESFINKDFEFNDFWIKPKKSLNKMKNAGIWFEYGKHNIIGFIKVTFGKESKMIKFTELPTFGSFKKIVTL